MVGDSFRLFFSGEAEVAARRVKKFLGCQRVDGKWQKVFISRPQVGGDPPEPTQIFFGADRSNKENRNNILLKKLKTFVEANCGKQVDKVPRDGLLVFGWQRLCTVKDEAVVWDEKIVKAIGVDSKACERRHGQCKGGRSVE